MPALKGRQELVANCDLQIAEKKRDQKREIRGILAMNPPYSLPLRQYFCEAKIVPKPIQKILKRFFGCLGEGHTFRQKSALTPIFSKYI